MDPLEKAETTWFAARTERGQRSENQDAMTDFSTPFGEVYLVADGMGGVQGGATASLIAAEGYMKYLSALSPELPLSEALQRSTAAINTELQQYAAQGGSGTAGMGSTVVLAVIKKSGPQFKVTLGHIGDSRAYVLQRGALRQLTKDHSAVQRLVDAKQITAEEARTHPNANVISRALGPEPQVEIEVTEVVLQSGDTLLLCTDGLSGYVEDSVIATELKKERDAGSTADALIDVSLAQGSTDNITVHVLQLQEAAFRAAEKKESAAPASDAMELEAEKSSTGSAMFRYGGTAVIGIAVGLLGARHFLYRHADPSAGVTPTTQPTTTVTPSHTSSTGFSTPAPASPPVATAHHGAPSGTTTKPKRGTSTDSAQAHQNRQTTDPFGDHGQDQLALPGSPGAAGAASPTGSGAVPRTPTPTPKREDKPPTPDAEGTNSSNTTPKTSLGGN